MKAYKVLLVGGLLTAFTCAAEISDADRKWGEAVQKMIAAGPATLSTPSESRVELAKSLAKKAGRKCEVERVATGYRIVVK